MKMNLIALAKHQVIAEVTLDNGLIGDEAEFVVMAKARIKEWSSFKPPVGTRYFLIHATAADSQAHNDGLVANPVPDHF
jgi:hypothetical protein